MGERAEQPAVAGVKGCGAAVRHAVLHRTACPPGHQAGAMTASWRLNMPCRLRTLPHAAC